MKFDQADFSIEDLQLHELIFNEGSDHAFIDLAFSKDGLWEGIEKGKIIVDKVDSQKNVISDWRNSNVEILINDLDSVHNGSGNNQSRWFWYSRSNPTTSSKRSIW